MSLMSGPEAQLDAGGSPERFRTTQWSVVLAARDLTADRLFERRWALMLLQHVLGRLRDELRQAGKGEQFEQLKVFLTGEKSAGHYVQAAEVLGATPGAVRVAVHRLRRRYRELL